MRTLLEKLEAGEFQSAIVTLDFSKDPEKGPYARLRDAQRLRAVIDRMVVIDFAKISDDPDGTRFRFPPDAVSQPIVIERLDSGYWKFSAETVDRIDEMYELYRDKPQLNIPQDEREWYARELILGNETWRVIFLFSSIFLSLAIGNVFRSGLRWREARLRAKERELAAIALMTLAKTIVPIVFLVGLHIGIRCAGARTSSRDICLGDDSNYLHFGDRVHHVSAGRCCRRAVATTCRSNRQHTERHAGADRRHLLAPDNYCVGGFGGHDRVK